MREVPLYPLQQSSVEWGPPPRTTFGFRDSRCARSGANYEQGLVHTVDYDPFIKSQIASHDEREGHMRGKFGHVASKISKQRNPRGPPCGGIKTVRRDYDHPNMICTGPTNMKLSTVEC